MWSRRKSWLAAMKLRGACSEGTVSWPSSHRCRPPCACKFNHSCRTSSWSRIQTLRTPTTLWVPPGIRHLRSNLIFWLSATRWSCWGSKQQSLQPSPGWWLSLWTGAWNSGFQTDSLSACMGFFLFHSRSIYSGKYFASIDSFCNISLINYKGRQIIK